MVQWPDTPFPLQSHLVLCGRRGSEAHGTYIGADDPNSIDDRDLMGVVIPPRQYYLGTKQWDHAESIKGEWDVVLYEMRKFVGLLIRQNPNVLSLLWLRQRDYTFMNYIGGALVAHRDIFRARNAAYHSFIGYAHGQLKKMTGFGEFKGYMGEKRKRLVEQFGYDVKNAAHLVRILRMGKEYLETGELTVFRPDAAELIEIKQGRRTLYEIQRMADDLFEQCRVARDKSPLPEAVPMHAVDNLLVELIGRAIR